MYIYSESELRGFTVKELREEAKSLKIKFWYNKTKAELVSDILEATAENNINNVEENDNMEEIREATISEDSTVEKVEAVQAEDEIAADNSYATLISHKKTPGEYIDNVEVGMIIAFATEPEKAISAKVKEIFRAAEDNGVKEVLAVSKNGYTYKVPRAAIVWVKTGHRWPRGIYDKLRNSYIKREDATAEIKEESETF